MFYNAQSTNCSVCQDYFWRIYIFLHILIDKQNNREDKKKSLIRKKKENNLAP